MAAVYDNFAGAQSIGDRKRQEDNYAFVPLDDDLCRINGLLAVLADGMGGHSAGDAASNLVVETFARKFLEAEGGISEAFLKSLEAANLKVAELAEEVGECGSTLVAAYVCEKKLYWMSVGDSPMFLIRKGKIERLNEDHSLRAIATGELERGEITPDMARAKGNCLLSAVCGDEIEKTDFREIAFELEDGDIIVIASDGIETLSRDEIAEAAAGDVSAEGLVRSLLNAVENKAKPQQDNTTVMIIKI